MAESAQVGGEMQRLRDSVISRALLLIVISVVVQFPGTEPLQRV